MHPATPLNELDWIPAPRRRQLERVGITTVEGLLTHFPKRYEDRTRFDHFPTGDSEQPVCVCGLVKNTTVRRIRGWQKMFDVVLEEDNPHALSQPLTCRWFNAHWVEKMIVNGQRLVVYGRPKRSKSSVMIAHPEFEIVENDAEVSLHLNRITPIHRATEGLSPRVMSPEPGIATVGRDLARNSRPRDQPAPPEERERHRRGDLDPSSHPGDHPCRLSVCREVGRTA